MKKELYLLSPSDRFNYGDMLFPYILQHYLGQSVDCIKNCATTRSDLKIYGGMPTLPYDELFKANQFSKNYLIVAGGESLFVKWPVVLSFLHKDICWLLKKMRWVLVFPHTGRIYEMIIGLYTRIKYHPKTLFPFTIGLNEINNFQSVMYNSVGSVYLPAYKNILKNKKCKAILDSSEYLSVRDSESATAMKMMGVVHEMAPDSAILMSEVFSDDFLERKKSIDVNLEKKTYIFFQINTLSARGKETFFASILNDISAKYEKKILLCPIGTALGHEDDVALKNVLKHLDRDKCVMVERINIWDIMYLIKNSCLYFGTSLHGAITAMSFSVPMVTHGKKKVAQYIKDWGGCFTDLENLKKMVEQQLQDPVVISSDKQKNAAKCSMMRMKSILEKM